MCLDVFLAINILALEGSLPFFLDNYHPLKLYANVSDVNVITRLIFSFNALLSADPKRLAGSS